MQQTLLIRVASYRTARSNGPINSLDGQIQLVWLSQTEGLGFLF